MGLHNFRMDMEKCIGGIGSKQCDRPLLENLESSYQSRETIMSLVDQWSNSVKSSFMCLLFEGLKAK